jgi:hypothetical protein
MASDTLQPSYRRTGARIPWRIATSTALTKRCFPVREKGGAVRSGDPETVVVVSVVPWAVARLPNGNLRFRGIATHDRELSGSSFGTLLALGLAREKA